MLRQESGTRTESDAFGELQVRRLQLMHVLQRSGVLNLAFRSKQTNTGEPRPNGKGLLYSSRSCDQPLLGLSVGEINGKDELRAVKILTSSIRSLENFKINQPQDRMPPPVVRAFGILKGAAATVNMTFGLGKSATTRLSRHKLRSWEIRS